MDLKERIQEIATRHLKSDDHFVVDVVLSVSKGPTKVLILLDGDKGINIDDCAALSRAVGGEIEENGIIDSKYTLEVSSPGVDFPLSQERQYIKNLGKLVKVTKNDGTVIEGTLKGFADERITLSKKIKKDKDETVEEIPLSDVKKTIVQISFK